ncbi:RimK family alpha-L-glutamate ligase [Paraconexibacter sp.]|uniref:ATP-grasp domain-containing protein n=1 Tax=Paraconexibacter sp. TaxID=2949640 RepID=UPI003562B156
MTDILFASCDGLPALDEDSAPLRDALTERGVVSRVAAWDDPSVDWSAARVVMARSTWDYAERREAFVAWAERVEATGVPLWPDAQTIAWNTEKSYLRHLAAGGLRTVPTVWVDPQDDPAAVPDRIRDRGWDDAIVKPQIGVGAIGLRRFTGLAGDAAQATGMVEHTRELLGAGGAMVQPYLPGVAEHGELSVFFAAGRLTHAIRKRAAAGDFRVQPEHGGTHELVRPERDELDTATWAVAAVAARFGEPPLIARADLVADLEGRPALIELELIEPRLFLRGHPEATDAIADAVLERLAVLR